MTKSSWSVATVLGALLLVNCTTAQRFTQYLGAGSP
jgi:hypothetical protein